MRGVREPAIPAFAGMTKRDGSDESYDPGSRCLSASVVNESA
jgi:hypothetical protein